ncbi:uncharacterized protein LOC103793597 isoform X13 [Callithrix jacchus]
MAWGFLEGSSEVQPPAPTPADYLRGPELAELWRLRVTHPSHRTKTGSRSGGVQYGDLGSCSLGPPGLKQAAFLSLLGSWDHRLGPPQQLKQGEILKGDGEWSNRSLRSLVFLWTQTKALGTSPRRPLPPRGFLGEAPPNDVPGPQSSAPWWTSDCSADIQPKFLQGPGNLRSCQSYPAFTQATPPHVARFASKIQLKKAFCSPLLRVACRHSRKGIKPATARLLVQILSGASLK